MTAITFLMGSDPAGTPNPYYTFARDYFSTAGSDIVDAPANGQTIEGVIAELTKRNVPQTTINLVSHASGFGSMDCAVSAAAQAAGGNLMTADDVQNALAAKTLAVPLPPIVTDKTRVVVYGCDIGRTRRFLVGLSGLFGSPGEVLAPRRIAVFTGSLGAVKYRVAQTWSLTRKAPLLAGTTGAPTGGWPTFRTAFVNDATSKFQTLATATGDPLASDTLKSMLTTAAASATAAQGPTFFFEEVMDIVAIGGATAAQAAAGIHPVSNGDPVTSTPATVGGVDDTTVVTTIGPSDAYPTTPAATAYRITVAILAQLIDRDVAISQGPDYASYTASAGRAPALGPHSVNDGSGDGDGDGTVASTDPMQDVTQALLAGGVSQSDIDALLASAPTGDATEGIVMDAPQADPDGGDTGFGPAFVEPEEPS